MSDQAIDRLLKLRDKLDSLDPNCESELWVWVAEATPVIRHDWPTFLADFQQASAEPQWAFLPVVGDAPGANATNARSRGSVLETNGILACNSKRKMLSTLDGILAIAPHSQQEGSLPTLEQLCRRFPLFVRHLAARSRGKPPVTVNDEYDVQFLLNALLRIQFEEVVPESPTPSFAGGSTRMDFLLKREQIVLETKMTRPNLRGKEVADELLIDIQRYAVHPDCRTLACFVYDPGHFIDNPRGLERDLSGEKDNVNAVVWVSPTGV